jgi:glutamate N-acetyltransferase/amino-acid N-acetyltransferase
MVMSTGVIGQHLPMGKLERGIAQACEMRTPNGGASAATAILTTDTRPKEMAVEVAIDGRTVTVAGMCKGAGMIHPNMATMLGLLVTDAAIEREALQAALHEVVSSTFNAVTVDGDTSTNDTVLLLASGAAGNDTIVSTDSPAFESFCAALLEVSTALAQGLARDGEGATKFVTVEVTGAPNRVAGQQVAKSIANSLLVKTAVYGADANWGRVLCAAGYSGVDIEPERLSLWLSDGTTSLHLVRGGEPYQVDEEVAADILSGDEITFRLDLGIGDECATVWTCDLTHAYVDINAHYRT